MAIYKWKQAGQLKYGGNYVKPHSTGRSLPPLPQYAITHFHLFRKKCFTDVCLWGWGIVFFFFHAASQEY